MLEGRKERKKKKNMEKHFLNSSFVLASKKNHLLCLNVYVGKKTLKQNLKFVSTENLKILELLDCMNLVLHKINHGPIVVEKDPKKGS